jgi:cytochrome c553/glyoxylase-like metal-dependent hydrolase (beta-lactamase superfamily II)
MKLASAVVIPALLFVFGSTAYAAEDEAPQPSWVEVLPDIEGDVAAGREKAETCNVCHGDNGFSEHRYYPVLAGQIKKYLVFQLHHYRDGDRPHPLMSPLTQALSDVDIADLSAYYSSIEIAEVVKEDPETRREVKHIKGGLFNIQDNNNTFTSFLVTTEGIILTDPITQETAAWIKAELDRRFDVPVKYVIYSHHHDDHAPGAEFFDDAIIIAHENAVRALEEEPENPTLPPHLTFSDKASITLGGKTVNLIYLGKTHTDNLIAVHYPDERAVLAVDSLWIDRVAYGDLGHNSYFPGWVEGLKIIEAIDFDTLLVAHGHYGKASGFGSIGTHANVVEFRSYFETLYEAVQAAKKEGLSLEEAVETIDLPEFSHMDMYEQWFKLNVKGVYVNSPNPE